MGKRIAIVGAGLGGLSAALRLAHLGFEVEIFEKTDQVGGRNRAIRVGDCDFDAGPTLLMMLDPFRRLFQDVGERLEDHLELRRCDPAYRVFYADGTRLDAQADERRLQAEIAKFSPSDASALPRFKKELAAIYEVAVPNFVETNFLSPWDFFAPRKLGLVQRHKMLANLGKRVEKHFRDPRIHMLFSFQTLYLGLSPYDAPWVYSTLVHMELAEGIWYPMGGVAKISEAIAALARKKGVQIRLNQPVKAIEGKSVILESGGSREFDAIICNADLPYAERELLGQADKVRQESCSAFMIYAEYEGELPDLLHHNVFFSSDFRGNLDEIFNLAKIPEDPSFYACISARTDPNRAEPGIENLYILIPCPNLERRWKDKDEELLMERAFARLQSETGFCPSNIRHMARFGPRDWRDRFNLDKGAAFGLSHHLSQSAYFRPSNRSRVNPNVYFAGASTIPGNGMPMVVISAELVAQRILEEIHES